MFRTPAQKDASSQGSAGSPRSAERAGYSLQNVRRSIEELEAGRIEPQAKSPANPKPDATPPQPLTTTKKLPNSLETQRTSADARGTSRKPEQRYLNLTAEARACLNKAKLQAMPWIPTQPVLWRKHTRLWRLRTKAKQAFRHRGESAAFRCCLLNTKQGNR